MKDDAGKKKDIKLDKVKGSKCFTYNVDMVIQVIAEDELSARERLDRDGGYVTKREVALIDAIALYSGEAKEKKEDDKK